MSAPRISSIGTQSSDNADTSDIARLRSKLAAYARIAAELTASRLASEQELMALTDNPSNGPLTIAQSVLYDSSWLPNLQARHQTRHRANRVLDTCLRGLKPDDNDLASLGYLRKAFEEGRTAPGGSTNGALTKRGAEIALEWLRKRGNEEQGAWPAYQLASGDWDV